MRTPAGQECRFYYQDFHRGSSTQECRLIDANPNSEAWKPGDCSDCPVPGILLANSSPNLILEAAIKKGFLGFNRRIELQASCSRHLVNVSEPHIGCPKCAREKPGLRELFGE
jgi:hypothetical protein